MKAIRMHKFGGPEVLKLEDAPLPEPADDEVLIKVYAAGVNPVDWKIREGLRKEKFPTTFPLTPGWDVSGEIEKVGKNVKNFREGDEVYGRPDLTRNGAYAEYLVVKATLVSLKPKTIDHEKAAGVPLAGQTAWQGLFDHGQLEAGQKVLIHGASGGVGTFAIQFARWKGAHVIGTASKKNSDFLKQLGADEIIDYKNEKFDDKLTDVDLVFDTIGGDTQRRSIRVLKKGGRLITTLKPENQEAAQAKGIQLEGFTAQSYPKELEQIAQLIDAGKVKPVIAKIFPLEQAVKAQELGESGHVLGKIILKVI